MKVKRLSLENIKKNGVVLQTSCTSEQKEVMDISSITEKLLQVVSKDETVVGDIHRCKSTDTSSKTELLKTDQTTTEIDEHKADKIALLSSDQIEPCMNEKGMETLSSLGTEAKSEANMKKTLPHKRPERVPLPLLAQFLKQRKSKARPTTAKSDTPSSSLESEKSCEPFLIHERSSALMSSSPCITTTNLDLNPVLASLSQKVTSTIDAINITSLATALSSATASPVQVETQLSDGFSPSPVGSDPFSAPNTTSPSKPDSDPIPDSMSSVFHNADMVSMPDLENTLRSQSDISSPFTCHTVHDTCSPTTTGVNNDFDVTPIVPSVTPSVFDVPSSTDIIPYQKLAPVPDVAESASISDCRQLFSEEIPPHTLCTHEESLSLPLDDPSSPAFSLPSPAPSSPDPFPPSLFCERPVPPRKTLDSFPERLLNCTAASSPDLFPLGLFNDNPVPPRKLYDFVQGRPLDGLVTSKEPLSTSVLVGPEDSKETIDLFSSQCSDRPGPLNDLQSALSCETIVSDHHIVPEPTKQLFHGSTFKKSKAKQKKIGKLKFSEDEVFEGPVPVPMQPSLEDVEGQLFVSFVSKVTHSVSGNFIMLKGNFEGSDHTKMKNNFLHPLITKHPYDDWSKLDIN